MEEPTEILKATKEEMHDIIGKSFRYLTNYKYKKLRAWTRKKYNKTCPICNKALGNKQLHTIHRKGYERIKIISS